MEKIRFIFILLLFQSSYAQLNQGGDGGVGIGTTDPQQKLHIASSTGTLRVESLNSTNNSYNGGGTLNYPLYVDDKGDFTLAFTPALNSADTDAMNDTNLPTSTVYLDPNDRNGIEETNIVSYTITVTRPILLEIKYNLSFNVYYDTFKNNITDNLARRIMTYVNVTGSTRKYGRATKCYSSGSLNSVTGTMYNFNTTYVSIPAAGTYDITFVGVISTNTKANGTSGTYSESSYVEFATGHDFVFFRMH